MTTPPAKPPLNSPPKQAGVPRRFGIGSSMVVTAAFALLFMLLKLAEAPFFAYVVYTGIIVIVGISQAVLFGGQNPRMASVVTGASIGLLAAIFIPALESSPRLHNSFLSFPFAAIFGAIGGAIYGYIAGLLIAGVFLLMDMADKFNHRRRTKVNMEEHDVDLE